MLLNFHFLQASKLLNQDSQKYAQGSDQGPRLQQRGKAVKPELQNVTFYSEQNFQI